MSNNRPKRLYRALLTAALAVSALIGGFYIYSGNTFKKVTTCNDGTAPITLSLVGDLLIGGGKVWQQIAETNFQPSTILGDYYGALRKSDILFANFEGVITRAEKARQKNLPASFSLRSDPQIIDFLKHFNNLVLSFANNHSADFGLEGIEEAIKILDENKIGYVGIGRSQDEAIGSNIISFSNIKIAFLAFTDLLPSEFYAAGKQVGVAELNAENLKNGIELAKKHSDFAIVSLHTVADIKKPTNFFPDEHQKFFSRLAIDYGADLVVGQHPHRLQSIEKYKNGLIFYSLGTFLYDPDVSLRYPKNHPLYDATRFNGGGVLNLAFCGNKLNDFVLIPTAVVDNKGRLMVVADSWYERILIELLRWRILFL